MSSSTAKVRIGPAGVHYFSRESGLNVLFDEVLPPEGSWHAAPRQVSIALTNACDLECAYCYAPKIPSTLNYQILCGWLSEFDQHGALGVGFGGGEPSLHPRFADLCEFAARQTSLAVTFTSHGHHLVPKLLSKLVDKVNFIRLSMDGIGATYEQLRGRSFSAFKARLRDVRAVAPFGLNFVVNADTIDDLDAAIDFAHSEGAHEFLLLPEQSTPRRCGVGQAERDRLKEWVRSYRGQVRLAVSESDAAELGACDPCGAESGLRAFAHISAASRLQRSSFESTGVQIREEGVMAALQELELIK
ncbi:MAG: radical SAM protein [Opitutales bacterium]|nr:radical SAM protein [Opitutales bacterium]